MHLTRLRNNNKRNNSFLNKISQNDEDPLLKIVMNVNTEHVSKEKKEKAEQEEETAKINVDESVDSFYDCLTSPTQNFLLQFFKYLKSLTPDKLKDWQEPIKNPNK